MANKISGTINVESDAVAPLPKFRVQAWDDDWPSGDDLLGEDLTDQDGKYQIFCTGRIFDEAFPGLSTMYPDIYITAEIKNKAGQWIRLGRSQVFKNHDPIEDLSIDLAVKIEPVEKVQTPFNPATHGFHFYNSFKFRPEFLNIEFKEMGLGFCGGMSAGALKRFKENQPIPDSEEIPTQGSELFEELKNRQIRSMPADVIAKILNFQSAPDQDDPLRKTSIARLTRDEWPKLKVRLDNGDPVILILIRANGMFDNPTKNHQVLSIGYEYDPTCNDLVIDTYDPNKPDVTHSLSMNLALPDGTLNLKDSTRKKTRGFFVNPAGARASQ
jgi:hypothetical protein